MDIHNQSEAFNNNLNFDDNNSNDDSDVVVVTECVSLPMNCCPLSHQVAGHFYGQGRTKLGLLQSNDGLVLKPVQSPPNGQREHEFYKHIFLSKNSELNEDELCLRKLLPVYHGSILHDNSKFF